MSSTDSARKIRLLHYIQNNEISTLSYAKINSKWIKDLNIICEAMKLLKENIGEKIHDINLMIS